MINSEQPLYLKQAPMVSAGSAFGKLGKRIAMAVAVVEAAQRVYNYLRNVYWSKLSYTVTVSEKDPIYPDVHAWLISALPDEKHRSLSVSSKRPRSTETEEDYYSSDSTQPVKPAPLTVYFNDSSTRMLKVGGYKVAVTLQMPDTSRVSLSSREPDYAKINFTTWSHDGQQAVISQLEKLNEQRSTTRKAVLKMVGQWGNWTTRSDLPPRTMESVILPPEQKNRIREDLGTFLASEEKYNRLALPWHRGYMFHGPPGTGKTSLVKALANEFNLDLWYISLSDLKAESSLLGLLSDVGPRSILLLEDIDTMRITHDRDGSEQGTISMSSLLNTLDGVATPHGLITVMTTNRFDVLDPALTRAGRMDMVEMLDYPSVNVISDMYKHFFGVTPNWKTQRNRDAPIKGLSTSQVAEVMKRHMDDPAGASKAIRPMLDSVPVTV